jgi:predicted LPLAT superfamily acyltransferase
MASDSFSKEIGDGRSEARVRAEPSRINDRRRGNRLGFLSFYVVLRLFGRRGAYGLLGLVTCYYLLFDSLARRLARPYLRHRFPDHSGWRRAVDYYKLFYNQGISLIDRYRMLVAPANFIQEVAHYDRVQALVADKSRGFVLLVSHVGNWQALMLALSRMERDITLLMKPEENPVTQEYLRFQDFGQRLRMISPDTPMGGVVEMTQRFGQGDVIAIMGDRAYGAATLPAEFLGEPTYFPRGPFKLAAAWGCPVVVMFAVKTGTDAYTVDMADVIEIGREGNREENLKRAMQRYADRLQEFAQTYPYQVHLFEDVWKMPEPRKTLRRS